MKNFKEYKIKLPHKLVLKKYLAHLDPFESLETHIRLTKESYEDVLNFSKLEKEIDKLLELNFKRKEVINIAKQIFHDAIIYHDIGKLSPKFQRKMRNKFFIDYEFDEEAERKLDEKHSRLGWHIFLILYFKHLEKTLNEKELVKVIALSSVIAFHHSNLKNWQKNIDEFLPTKKKLEKAVDILNIAGISFNNYNERIYSISKWFEENEDLLRIKDRDFLLLFELCHSLLILSDQIAIRRSKKLLYEQKKL